MGQSMSQVKTDKSTWLCGEGRGETEAEADREALRDLVSQISTAVVSSFEMVEDERTQGDILDAKSYVTSKLSTFSGAVLTNTEKFPAIREKNEYVVVRYIRRAEIDKIFESRIDKVKEYARLGFRAENDAKIDDALRYYYWAFSLLKSVRYPSKVEWTDPDGQKCRLVAWLPDRLSRVMNDVEVTFDGVDGDEANFLFNFRGKPVTSIDYRVDDGYGESLLYSAKNGQGVAELPYGETPSNIQMRLEYAYRGEARLDDDVRATLGVVKGNTMRKSFITVSTKKGHRNTKQPDAPAAHAPKHKATAPVPATAPEKENATTTEKKQSDAGSLDIAKYSTVIDEIKKAISTKNYSSVSEHFTADGLQMWNDLVSYGKARLLASSKPVEFIDNGRDIIARSVPMSFSFRRGMRRSFVEDVTFTFNRDGKIDCVAFGLGDKGINDIMQKGAWPITARLTLLEFLENYKTAYSLKRWDYLNQIFDKDAVIISGHVVRKASYRRTDGGLVKIAPRVVTSRKTKEEYMAGLKRSFASNEFINIRLSSNDITKVSGEETYGIQIKQDYYSSSYADSGYLLLVVDIKNPDSPTIYVRVWQPEPDPVEGLANAFNYMYLEH